MRPLTLILSLLLTLCSATAQEDPNLLVREGQNVPYFSVVSTDGTTTDTDKLRGKTVLITLWASWCPLCRKEMKAIGRSGVLDSLIGRDDFVFLPISREESRETVAKFLSDRGYSFASGIDADRSIYSLFATQDIPRNIVVDSEGRIALIHTGYTKRKMKRLVATIENMLNQK